MHDEELDLLLTRLATTPSDREQRAAEDLAAASHALRPTVARRHGRRSLMAGVAGGILAISGAGSLAAYQLSIPPFQTIPDGIQRTEASIPVNYRDADGTARQCLMFLEFQNLSSAQLQGVEAYLRSTDWSGYGQGVANEIGPATTAQALEHAVIAAVGEDVRDRVRSTFPGIEVEDPVQAYRDDQPLMAGTASTCREPDRDR